MRQIRFFVKITEFTLLSFFLIFVKDREFEEVSLSSLQVVGMQVMLVKRTISQAIYHPSFPTACLLAASELLSRKLL